MPKDRKDAPARPARAVCPCCGGELLLTESQVAGQEPVDCPEPACGFNEARRWDLDPAKEAPAS